MEQIKFRLIKEKPAVVRGAKEKLANMRELAPGAEEEVYQYADYLAQIVSNTLNPSQLSLLAVNARLDLLLGVNLRNGERVFNPLAGREDINFFVLSLCQFPPVAKKVLGDVFIEQYLDREGESFAQAAEIMHKSLEVSR